jgi:quercetin dioxygenase-like cupin family protein
MANSHFKIEYNQIVDGIEMKIIHQENDLVMTEMNILKGIRFPPHVHQSDHSGYLVKGKIQVVADGIVSVFVAGDSWCLRKEIVHYTEALDDSVVLEVFSYEGEIEGFPIKHGVNTSTFKPFI